MAVVDQVVVDVGRLVGQGRHDVQAGAVDVRVFGVCCGPVEGAGAEAVDLKAGCWLQFQSCHWSESHVPEFRGTRRRDPTSKSRPRR